MAQAAASSVNKEMEISMERLSTGKRINGAADDAAGVAIASRLSAEIRGTNQAIRNALDAQALIDTAEGAHIEIESILQRMRELSVQARNDTNDSQDRTNLQAEMNQLTTEIDRISSVSSWAGQKLLTGSGGNNANGTFNFQVGSQTNSADLITATISSMSAAALGVGAGNATAGANGATLTELGETILQIGGTPVVGDTYKYTINNTAFQVQIVAEGTTGNFDYKLSTDGGATFGAAVLGAGNGKAATKAGVADIIAHQINLLTAHPGLTATANSDGSVTVGQTLSLVGSRTEIDATPGNDLSVTVLSTTGTKTINSVTVPDANIVEFDITNFTHGTSTITLTINGAETIYTPDFGGADVYTDDAAGIAAGLQAALNANSNMVGVSWQVDVNGGKVRVGYTQNAANLISGESAVAGASSTALDVSSVANAKTAIDKIDLAIKSVNSQRATLGAISNRLDSTVSNLTNVSQNLQGGRGRIEDADFAAETTNLARTQILQQASTAMLAQANAAKQNVLSLLQG